MKQKGAVMARPRKDSPEPPARERIIEAFWELIIDTPIKQITVKMLTEAARCNRSTFYRHFEDVYNVAEQIEVSLELPQLPGMLMKALQGDSGPEQIATVMGGMQNFDRLCLLLSRNGDPDYHRRFKDSILAAWANEFGFAPEELDVDARVFIEFCASGVVGILTYRGDTNIGFGFADISELMLGEVVPALFVLLQKSVRPSGAAQRHHQATTHFLPTSSG
jgi:AcrR family transcriptional regulator